MSRVIGGPKGQQGSWYADVRFDDGTTESLPCVRSCFMKRVDGVMRYRDEISEALDMNDPRVLKFFDDIRGLKRVVVTKDKRGPDRGPGEFTRLGYVDVFDVDDFQVDDRGYGFRFVRRYEATSALR